MKPYHPAFSPEEYQSRLENVRRSMESRLLEVLIISDPSNMAWLTGYDGWSFYVHQCVVVTLQDSPPVLRTQDGRTGGVTDGLASGTEPPLLSR